VATLVVGIFDLVLSLIGIGTPFGLGGIILVTHVGIRLDWPMVERLRIKLAGFARGFKLIPG
jgi:hypothetical protein